VARNTKPSAKNVSGEYATFENALKKVLSVSPAKIKSKITEGKHKRIKRPSASHVSAD
jgi:hypothetical protein